MNKIFTLILVLCLLLPSAVLAEEDISVYAWDDVREEAESAGGRFVRLKETPYEFWLPDSVKEIEPYITSSYVLYGGLEYDARDAVPDPHDGSDYLVPVNFRLYMISKDSLNGRSFDDVFLVGRKGKRCTVNGVDGYITLLAPDGRTSFISVYLPLDDSHYMYLTIPCNVDEFKDGKPLGSAYIGDNPAYASFVRVLVSSVRPAE